jgi:thiol:disulfide interchange protein
MDWTEDLEQARTAARDTGRPLLALVTVSWCPWCVKLDNETLADDRVQMALEGLVCARLDGDVYDRLAYDYDFDVFPTALVFGADGEYRGMLEGFHDPDEFRATLSGLLTPAGTQQE